MKKIFLLLLSTLSCLVIDCSADVIANVQSLIDRVLHRAGVAFSFRPKMELIPFANEGIDVFEIDTDSSMDTVVLRGSSGVALSAAFGHYLRYIVKSDFHWEYAGNYSFGTFPVDLSEMPIPSTLIRITFLGKYRYYQNTCTASYSFAWRDWTAWEQEIDWMAMSGINLPLAFTGQEVVWQKLWQSYGVSQAGIDAFFTGPAFLAWNRMSNIRGFGGPLPVTFIEAQADLQIKILGRYQELEITPVLPAFNGVVPEEVKAIYPDSSITQLGPWAGFPPEYTCNYIVSPTDPLFIQIGSDFLRFQEEVYGKQTHIYNCDTFNENVPASSDPTYLSSASASVYNSMIAVDSEAVWLMQGWLFRNDASFWTDEAISSYLGGVPDSGMVVLDLSSEEIPLWDKIVANNKSFIWCLLHNYGGSRALYGNLTTLAVEPLAAKLSQPILFLGTGLTMEAIDQNPVVYEFMTEVSKSQIRIDTESWLSSYSFRRYSLTGHEASMADLAWKILFGAVYNGSAGCSLKWNGTQIHGSSSHCNFRSLITEKPGFGLPADTSNDATVLVEAWELLQLAGSANKSPAWRYDLVDVGRQVMSNLFVDLYALWTSAYNRRSYASFRSLSTYMLRLISDFDVLLGSHESFLVGTWIESAKSWATTEEEKALFNYNARNQITLWGPDGNIDDYAAKNWAGLIGAYYSSRWQLFMNYVSESIESNQPIDMDSYYEEELNIGKSFCDDLSIFPTTPLKDTEVVSLEMQEKYGAFYTPLMGYDKIANADITLSENLLENGTWTKCIRQLQFLCDADNLCEAFTSTGFLKNGTIGLVSSTGIDVYVKVRPTAG